MSEHFQYLRAVVFDWAGTTIDHGCLAPAIVFQEIFRQKGINVTIAQAREPMGMAKRDHIAAIAAMPEVAAVWRSRFGRPCGTDDIDAMYAEFLPLQKQTLEQHCDLIEGAADTADRCRERGLKIGSTTGYTRELMVGVSEAARSQGYEPECVLCAEDAHRGRPAPYLLYHAAEQLDVYPMSAIVKVDDTPVGIEAGRNAGCWTVGVSRTGNGVGRSAEELGRMPPEEVQTLVAQAVLRLDAAGAHFTIESIVDIVPVLEAIEQRTASGQSPTCVASPVATADR